MEAIYRDKRGHSKQEPGRCEAASAASESGIKNKEYFHLLHVFELCLDRANTIIWLINRMVDQQKNKLYRFGDS